MRALLLMVFAWLVCAAPAIAAVTEGEYPRHGRDHTVGALPLYKVGGDAIRFTSVDGYYGTAWTLEIHRQDKNGAVGVFLPGRTYRNEAEERRGAAKGRSFVRVHLTTERYDALSAKVDTLLAEEAALPPPEDSRQCLKEGHLPCLIVCSDAPFRLTERRKNGKTVWMGSSCGDHAAANAEVGKLMLTVALANICELRPSPGACGPVLDAYMK